MSTASKPAPKLAWPFGEFCKQVGMGRTKGYDEVRKGRLRVLKVGKKSIVTAEDAQQYLDSLPRLELPPA